MKTNNNTTADVNLQISALLVYNQHLRNGSQSQEDKDALVQRVSEQIKALQAIR
tara:strand:+ start:120 stop:281 length:162 start_codon:yes stop_codon:yes gene_type:complete